MGEPEETRPGAKETRPAAGKTAPRARGLPPVRVLYVTGETREITFVTGTFDKVYPHLVLDFPVSLAAVPPLLEGEARHDAVVVGWSVPEVEALALIAAIRERQPRVAIVAVGERLPDMSLAAGADEFVQRDATMLTRLPVAIEESVRRQQERAALPPPVPAPPAPAPPAPGALETTAHAFPAVEEVPSADPPSSSKFLAFPEETTVRSALARMALIGDLDHAREAVAAEGVALDFVPLSAAADGTNCAAVVIDQSHLSVDATEALGAARAVSLPTILLYDPEAAESVIRAFAGDADELVAKETGWARQVVLRLNLAVARHRRSLEFVSLKAREGRLRATVESLPAAVLRLSPEGTILAANTVAVSLLGADESRQLLRKQFYSLVNPPDRDQCIEAIGRAYAGEKRSIEVWATTFSGESRALQLNAISVAADSGAPASVLTVVRDVTDRKRLEMALELVSTAPPAPTPAPAPATDPPAAPLVGLRDPVAPTPDAEALRALESQLQRMSKQARDSFEQLEASLRDAELHHEAVSARHREEQATFEAVQVERWRSYDAFVQAAAHPILHATSDGTLLTANPAFIAMLGADSAEALLARAASLDDITPADQWRAAVERWREAEGSSAPVESRWKRADGTVLALLLHGRRIGGQTKDDERLEVIVENVTARRALEFQLKRARRWEDVAKVTTGIAGDLQHAVAALGTSAERIAEVPADSTSQAALADIRQQATHAASLSRQLVAFGRRESREPEPLDLNDLVRGLEGVLRRMADEHVELTFEFGSRVDPAQADRSTVGETLVALTLAAAAALPAGGTLVVRTASQEVASRVTAPDGVEPGSYAVLTVAASGWGLTGVDAEAGGGSVAAIAQAVERSGGRLTTTVAVGQSVEFAVYLPLAAEVVEV